MGPYGKLHETVEFIRDSRQRRDEWFSIVNSGIDSEFEGMPPQDAKTADFKCLDLKCSFLTTILAGILSTNQ